MKGKRGEKKMTARSEINGKRIKFSSKRGLWIYYNGKKVNLREETNKTARGEEGC